MKKTLIIILLMPFMASAQKAYTILGKMPQLKVPAKAYLTMVQNGAWKDVDSTEIKNGAFQFTGSLAEPATVIVGVKRIGVPERRSNRDYTSFVMDLTKVTLTATDSIKNAVVSGSQSEIENAALQASIKPLTNKIMKLNDRFSKANPNSVNETAEARKLAGDTVMAAVAEIKSLQNKFVEEHLTSYMGLYTFTYHILDSKFNPVVAEPVLRKFTPELQASPLGKMAAEKIEVAKRRQTGIAATDFTQNDVNGNPFKLSSLRGKYVLVDFWASWCVPCRAENPNVVKAYTALKDKNFEIVSVSLDMGKESWLAAIKMDGMPWIHVSDLKYWKNEVAVMYGVASVPQNILVNPQGVIVAKNLRGENLLEQLKAYIK